MTTQNTSAENWLEKNISYTLSDNKKTLSIFGQNFFVDYQRLDQRGGHLERYSVCYSDGHEVAFTIRDAKDIVWTAFESGRRYDEALRRSAHDPFAAIAKVLANLI